MHIQRCLLLIAVAIMTTFVWGQGTKKTMKTVQKIAAPYETIDTANLHGAWWDVSDKEAPHATFEIRSTTILYPDEDEILEFRYRVHADSTLVIYYGRFNDTSKIVTLSSERLELKRVDHVSAFTKNKK